MGMSWFGIVQRKLFRSSSPHKTIIVLHTDTSSTSLNEAASVREEAREEIPESVREEAREEITELKGGNGAASSSLSSQKKEFTEEDIAAIKIQAIYRGHLVRRAFRALKSLVKLQAVVRGVCVRRQARIALHCMHALVRLQVTVRARQLLSRCSDD